MSQQKISVITRRYVLLAMYFVVAMIISQPLTGVVVEIIPLGLTFTITTLLFPITYIFGDIFAEVYGFKGTRLIIIGGIIMQALYFLCINLLLFIPTLDIFKLLTPDFYSAAKVVFPVTLRIAVSSLIAFFFGEYVNSIIMSRMKIWTNGRFLPLRTITSTMFGQLVDSAIFTFIAFYGVLPINTMLEIMFFETALKTMVEAAMTPVTVFLCGWLKKKEQIDIYDYNVKYNPISLDVVYDAENNRYAKSRETAVNLG